MKIILCLATILVLNGCAFFKSYTPDNPVEELTESLIKSYTGVDLDLSPGSPEQ